jgi:hypothetical protein
LLAVVVVVIVPDPWQRVEVTGKKALIVTIGVTVTAKLLAALVPQEFPTFTVMLPFCPAVPEVTVIEFVPAPAVIVQPVGTVQV